MGKEQSKLGGSELDLSGMELTTLPQERVAGAAGRIKGLNVSRNQLTSLQVAALQVLETLDVSHNQVAEMSGKGLRSLRLLDASFNLLSSLPTDLAFLRRLQELNLSHNHIGTLPDEIGVLENLTFLDLSHNKLKELPERFGELAVLQSLYLTDNELTSHGCRLGALCSLRMIDLSQNKLTNLPDVTFLASITKLYMAGNEMASLSPSVRLLPKLKELNLSRNRLSKLPKELADMPSLVLLDLAGNRFREEAIYGSGDAGLIVRYMQADAGEQRRMLAEAKRSPPPGSSGAGGIKISASELGLQRVNDKDDFVQPYTKRLYHIKGSEEVVAFRILPKSISLNDGDSFVLDVGKKVFVWHGPESNLRERAKAETMASMVAQQELGGAEMVVLDAGLFEDSPLLPEGLDFWDQLGGKSRIRTPEEGGEDDKAFGEQLAKSQLFKVVEDDESGRVDTTLLAGRGEPMTKDMLHSSHCFVLDCWGELFVWAGEQSSTNEKSYALLKAEELERQEREASRPPATGLQWIIDGSELVFFKEQFVDWRSRDWEAMAATMKKSKAVHVDDVTAYDKVLRKQIKQEEKRLSKGLSHAEMKHLQEKTSVSSLVKRLPVKKEKKEKKDKKEKAKLAKKEKKELEKERKHQEKAKKDVRPEPTPLLPEREAEKKAVEKKAASPKAQVANAEPKAEAKLGQGKVKIPAAFGGDAEATKPTVEKATAKKENEAAKKNDDKRAAAMAMEESKKADAKAKEKAKKAEAEAKAEAKKAKEEAVRRADAKAKEDAKKAEAKAKEEAKKAEAEAKAAGTKSKAKAVAAPQQKKLKIPAAFAEQEAKPEVKKVESKSETKNGEQKEVKEAKEAKEEKEVKKTSNRLARLKDPLTGPKRRNVASKNPLRARAARGSNKESGKAQVDVASRLAAAGAYGMLWALGADDGFFQKRRLKAPVASRGGRGKQPHLYHLKGRRRVFVREVELTSASLNSGDVFVLDPGTGKEVYQWNGKEANRIEKGSALDFAKKIKDKDHQGVAKIVVVEEKKDDVPAFWEVLGKGKVASAKSGGDDTEAEKTMRGCVKLFRAVEAEGECLLEPCGDGPYTKEVLESANCYILDCMAEIFPWTGKKAPIALRNATLAKAKAMAEERPFWVADVVRQLEGGEMTIFKERFTNWSSSLPITVAQAAVGLNTSKTKLSGKVDVKKLHQPAKPAKEVLIDDASGDVRVWRIAEFEKVAVDEQQHGNFWSGESNIVLYKYIWKNKDCFLIYYFQGRDSSINEKGTSAMLTIELDKEVSGMAKEVRVVQFKEPSHFLNVFKGRLIVHRGKVGPWAKKSGPFLYQVRSKSNGPIAVECDCSAWALNSNSTFVLRDDKRFFVWLGKASNAEERDFALNNRLLQQEEASTTQMDEGKEVAEFWQLLGGKAEYPLRNLAKRIDARLFHCSIATGQFDITEVVDYCQDDLSTHDVFLLDAYTSVYVWFGKRSGDRERRWSMEATMEYVRTVPKKQGEIEVYAVGEKEEPLEFRSHFHAWSGGAVGLSVPAEGLTRVSDLLAAYSTQYSYADLSSGNFPQALDTANLEHFLDEEEFETVFKMTRDQLAAMPAWKRTNLKKSLRLF